MASSALQLLGFLISLVGVAATIASVLMVDWSTSDQNREWVYDGLWMKCMQVGEQLNCKRYKTVLKLSTEVQATRAVMLLSLFLSALAVVVSSVGMKCSHFMDNTPDSKSKTALAGGILFVISGLLSIIITAWYVQMEIISFNQSNTEKSKELGLAVFVSWIGGFSTLIGGVFLSCMRCSRRSANPTNINHRTPGTKNKTAFV